MTESKAKKEAKPKNNIDVDIDDETAQGVYTNLAISNFNQEEFVVDFAYLQGQVPKAKVRSRVIMSPHNAKRIANMLMANIQHYESQFGPLSDGPAFPSIKLTNN